MQDRPEQVGSLLSDFEANVLAAVLLIMAVILLALGPRSAILVGLAFPGSFPVGANRNFFERSVVFGAPATQGWTGPSSAIAGVLVIATILTRVVTPAMPRLGEKRARRALPTSVPAE